MGRFALRLLLGLLLLLAALAERVVWTGFGSNSLWDNPANWNPVKIPQPTDDVLLPQGVNATVGTANGAQANSILINNQASLQVMGANVTLGAGGLTLLGAAQLLLDGGQNPFISRGPVQVNDTSKIIWRSSIFEGELRVAKEAQVTIGGAGQRGITGNVFVHGKLVICGNVVVGVSGLITNYGEVRVDSLVDETPDLYNFRITTLNGGRFSTNGTGSMRAEYFEADSGYLGVELRTYSLVKLSNVHIARTLFANSGLSLANATGANLTAMPGGVVTLSGSVQFQQLTSVQQLSCNNGAISVDRLILNQRITLSPSCPLRGSELRIGPDFFTAGYGTITGNTVSFSGTVRIAAGVTLLANQALTSTAQSIILDGILHLGAQATFRISNVNNGIITPTVPTAIGYLVNPGSFVVDSSSLIFTFTNFTVGTITITGSNSTLDLQNLKVNPTRLTLNTRGSHLKGEGISIGWGGLVGSAQGARMAIIFDGNYQECVSPCPVQSVRQCQSLEVQQAQ